MVPVRHSVVAVIKADGGPTGAGRVESLQEEDVEVVSRKIFIFLCVIFFALGGVAAEDCSGEVAEKVVGFLFAFEQQDGTGAGFGHAGEHDIVGVGSEIPAAVAVEDDAGFIESGSVESGFGGKLVLHKGADLFGE